MQLIEALKRPFAISEEERQRRLTENLHQLNGFSNANIWLVLIWRSESLSSQDAEKLANLYHQHKLSSKVTSAGELAEELGLGDFSKAPFLSQVTFNYDFKNPESEEDLWVDIGKGNRRLDPWSWGVGPALMDLDTLAISAAVLTRDRSVSAVGASIEADKFQLYRPPFVAESYSIRVFGKWYAEAIDSTFDGMVRPYLSREQTVEAHPTFARQGWNILTRS